MLYFIAAYVLLVVSAFVIFMVRERDKSRRKKLNVAAEKIVREDLLVYSLKNPYADMNRVEIPSSKRVMIALNVKAGGKKQEFVFDPAKQVSIGRGDKNQIIIHDPAVSDVHALIYVSGRQVCLSNVSPRRKVSLKRGSRQTGMRPGAVLVLKNGDIIIVGGYKLRVHLFMFDIKYC